VPLLPPLRLRLPPSFGRGGGVSARPSTLHLSGADRSSSSQGRHPGRASGSLQRAPRPDLHPRALPRRCVKLGSRPWVASFALGAISPCRDGCVGARRRNRELDAASHHKRAGRHDAGGLEDRSAGDAGHPALLGGRQCSRLCSCRPCTRATAIQRDDWLFGQPCFDWRSASSSGRSGPSA
jgi:hypothetical protein